jgi:hypothetical protein
MITKIKAKKYLVVAQTPRNGAYELPVIARTRKGEEGSYLCFFIASPLCSFHSTKRVRIGEEQMVY